MSTNTIIPDKRLFWFLKDGVRLNLNEPYELQMYIQQVLTYGRTDDIKGLLKDVDSVRFKRGFLMIRRFLPNEVGMFWEDVIASY